MYGFFYYFLGFEKFMN